MNCVQTQALSRRRNRWQDKRVRQLNRLANMRAAKARLRQARGDAGLLEREPKWKRWFPLELGVRDKRTGETAWTDFKSVRDAARRLAMVQRFYEKPPSRQCGTRVLSELTTGTGDRYQR